MVEATGGLGGVRGPPCLLHPGRGDPSSSLHQAGPYPCPPGDQIALIPPHGALLGRGVLPMKRQTVREAKSLSWAGQAGGPLALPSPTFPSFQDKPRLGRSPPSAPN